MTTGRQRSPEDAASAGGGDAAGQEHHQLRTSLAALLEGTDDLILVCDQEGRAILFNDAYRTMMREALGIEIQPGRPPHTLLEDPEAAAWWEWLHRRALAGERFRVEHTLTLGDEERYFELAYHPVRREGRVTGFSEIGRDITERRYTEQTLRLEKQRAQQYLDVAAVMMVVLNREGQVALINRKGCEVLGRPESEIVGRDWFTEFLPTVEGPAIRKVFLQLLAGEVEPVEYFENAVVRPSGELRIIAWHNAVLREDDGTIVATLSSGSDITQHREIEEEHARLRDLLHQAQKMEAVGTLAGGIAHDMNNVLMSIAGLTSVLVAESDPGDPRRADLESIMSVCERGRDLTRNLLGFARKGRFRTERLSLNHLVTDAVGLLRHTIGSQIELQTKLESGLRDIEGDASQLHHVLVNLVLNATAAIDGAGTITFETANMVLGQREAKSRPDLRPGAHVCLRVSDTGRGMDAEVKARAFEPFFTTRPRGEGTGLGLAMVYGTTRNHGGHVELTSAPGRGTTVELLLPAAAGEPMPVEPTPAAEPVPRTRETVLLVDDEEVIRNTGRRMLERLGHRVLVAADGGEAVDVLREHRQEVTVAILDLVMPGMDGPETLDALREISPSLPVIFSSGYATDGADLLPTGQPAGFLPKPYTLDELQEEIQRTVGGRR